MQTHTNPPPDHREDLAGTRPKLRTPRAAPRRGEGFAIPIIRRWQLFSQSKVGARLLPFYATLLGAALGALVADRLVRSMWHHAIFTGANQWRTVALLLVVFWIAIGAVAALAVLGPPDEPRRDNSSNGPDGAMSERPTAAPHSTTPS